MRWPSLSRRWYIAGGSVICLVLLVVVGLKVVYPRVAARMIEKKVTEKVTGKLGRKVVFGDIDVRMGHAVLKDLEIRGPQDGEMPLVHIARIDIDFDAKASLIGKAKLGKAKVDGVTVTMHRDAYGRDNVLDIVERFRDDTDKGAAKKSGSSLRPTEIAVKNIRVLADDALTGTTAIMAGGEATWTPELVVAHASKLSATTPGAPGAQLASLDIRKAVGQPPVVKLDGGEISLWPKLSLSGITGTVVASQDKPGTYVLDVTGGWGGVPGKLWTAKGALDTHSLSGSLDLEAAKFQLDRLAPILARSGIVDYNSTSVDTSLHVDFDRKGARFDGDLNLAGLNVGHPMIADKEVHDLSLSAKVAGSFDAATRTLELTRGDFIARNMPFSITGTVIKPRKDPKVAEWSGPIPVDQKAPPMRGPHGIQLLEVHLVVPPIKCQQVLDAIPAEMAPSMQGYKVKGTFVTDVKLRIDWLALDDTILGGSVGINKCKVLEEPEDSPKRLLEPFEHFVEYEKDEWMSFIVGPENPDFVPIDQISPNLIKSITTTEDGAFYKHHGFITSEFRTALVSDLKAGGFRHGASSITMQMVKNVLLYREKTLARKLQELFLTWHVEHTLTKDRILEIYFNVIEYGPRLYGIGPAARTYFGKAAKDLTLTEAAFFSSILPSPKKRYEQYCTGKLTKWTAGKIERILNVMLKREKITQEEYDKAIATPLVFVKDPASTETEKECLERVKNAIKNSRSTNPLADDDDDDQPDDKKAKKAKDDPDGKRRGPPTARERLRYGKDREDREDDDDLDGRDDKAHRTKPAGGGLDSL